MTNPVIPLNIPNARIPVVDERRLAPQHMARFFTDLVRRLGGQRSDYIQEGRNAALETQAMMLAVLRGIATGYYHTPSDPLDFTATGQTTATITIAQHTRSTAAATIKAGTVSGVTRGFVYFVYYDDAGNAGGTVTFHATTDVSILTSAGRRVVGAIHVQDPSPASSTEAG
jgi:hypothetical protein